MVVCYGGLRRLLRISSTAHSQSFSYFPLPVHTLGVMQGFHSLLICFLYTLSLAPVDKQLYYQLTQIGKKSGSQLGYFPLFQLPCSVAGRGDPFQGLKVGSCQTLRNELSEETHVLTKQEIFLGKGAWLESSRVRRTALPHGLQSQILW